MVRHDDREAAGRDLAERLVDAACVQREGIAQHLREKKLQRLFGEPRGTNAAAQRLQGKDRFNDIQGDDFQSSGHIGRARRRA